MRRIYVSHAVFWISVLGLAGSLIGFLTGTRVLMVPLIVFGVVGFGAFAVFTGTVASLALGLRVARPRPERGGTRGRLR
jgi:hypothetical protein